MIAINLFSLYIIFCQSHPPRTITLNVSANYMQYLLPYPSLVRALFFYNRHIMEMDGNEHITVIVLNYNLEYLLNEV